MTMSIKTANFRLKLLMKTFIYTFNAFNLHLSSPCISIPKFWMYTSWLLSWLIPGEMDNFNQVGATKFCVVAKVSSFKINLLFFQDALDAMKALGLNPGEQEMIDMTNEVGT